MEAMTAGPPLDPAARDVSMSRSLRRVVIAILAAAALLIVSVLPAWAIEAPITMVWVRHGQSTANAENITNTLVPGPDLTCCGPGTGQQQAIDVVPVLNGLFTHPYDTVYASDMVRTQQTSLPFRTANGLPLAGILPGIHEISAGIFDLRTPEKIGGAATVLFALPWMFGFLNARVPGRDQYGNIIDGRAFKAGTDAAVQQIWLETVGTTNATAAVFSHFGTIAFWTMMNAENADPWLLITQPLGNTNYVEVVGSPEDGWNVVSWNGTEVDPENPTITSRVFVAARTVGEKIYGIFHDPVTSPLALLPRPADLRIAADAPAAAINVSPEPESGDDPLAGDTADLTDGNKSKPAIADLRARGQRARGALRDVRDELDSPLKAVGDVVRAVTGNLRGAGDNDDPAQPQKDAA